MMLQEVFDWNNSSKFSPAYYFEVLQKGKRGRTDSILLESDPNTPHVPDNRYSYIALDSVGSVSAKGNTIFVNQKKTQGYVADPLSVLEDIITQKKEMFGYRQDVWFDGAPPFSSGGCIGYVGYDAKNWWIKSRDGQLTTKKHDGQGNVRDDQGFFDMYMTFPKTILAFDHKEQKIYVTMFGDEERKLQDIERLLKSTISLPTVEIKERKNRFMATKEEIEALSNMSYDTYVEMVKIAKEHIVSGNSYQVKLSQRLKLAVIDESWNIYKRLRDINPSPFSAYLALEGIDLVCCSPEELLKVENKNGRRFATTRPIGGTYPRGRNDSSDQELIEQFFKDEKEVAEHRMLIDLERNDLGSICKFRTVPRVGLTPDLESYSHVHHFVTTIPGELRDDVSIFDAFRAMFPGGTVTGCPKVRTMGIIDDLEPTARGPYTGSIGYFTFDDETQWNIMIRTLLHNTRTHEGFLQVGGGIVYDSDPKREWEETILKARALLQAV